MKASKAKKNNSVRKANEKSAPALKTGVLYARVSSREQSEGYSIDAQIKLLREYATKAGINVIHQFVEIESAGKAGRPQFGDMLETVKTTLCTAIVVEKTDRLLRNLKDWVLIDELDCEIHLVKESEIISRESSSHQKLIHGIKVLMAKNYIDNLSEEVRKGQREAVEQGYWPHDVPVGYLKENRIVIPDPIKSVQIEEMFRMVANGSSLDKVKQWANSQGLTATKRGSQPMGKGQVERIIKNLFYKGLTRWKEEIHIGNHPPIVSSALWDKANEALRSPSHQFKKHRHENLAFHGLIQCGTPGCGCAVVGEVKKGGRFIYYRCTHRRGNCSQGYVPEMQLEAQFLDVIHRVQIDNEIAEWLREALRESLDAETEFHRDAIANFAHQLDQVKRFKNKVYTDHVEGLIDRELFVTMMNNYQKQEISLVASLNSHRRADNSYLEEGSRLLELAQDIESIYNSSKPANKNRLLKILCSNCILLDGQLTVTLHKPVELIADFNTLWKEKRMGSDLSEPISDMWRG